MYEQMFDLIVERINVALDPSGAEEQGVDLEVDVLSIGELSELCSFACASQFFVQCNRNFLLI